MSKLIAYFIPLLIIAALAAGIFYQKDGLTSLSVTAVWLLSILLFLIGIMIIGLSICYESISKQDTKKMIADMLKACGKKRGFIRNAWNWAEFASLMVLLAYGGFIITAIVYCITGLFIRLAASIARDEASKQGLIEV